MDGFDKRFAGFIITASVFGLNETVWSHFVGGYVVVNVIYFIFFPTFVTLFVLSIFFLINMPFTV